MSEFYVRWPSVSGGGGGSGTVTSVSVVSANGLAGTVANPTTTPAITLSTSITGILQGNGTAISAATTGNLTEATSSVLTITAGTGAVLGAGTSIQVKQASTSQSGYLSSTDWNTFNGKQPALTEGNLTEATSAVLTISGGTSAVIGAGTSIQVKQSSTSQSGYLSSTDWNTFNGKQTSGSYITALTGDVTASGPGSVASTLATVNANVGSFGSNTGVPSFTVNAKGLVTAASNNAVVTTPAASTISAWDANKNLSANQFLEGETSTATAAATTTLTVSSTQTQIFTGVTTQTVLLPVASTLVNGQSFTITNLSTGVVTVESSGANSIQAMTSNTQLVVTVQNTAGGTGTASWTWVYLPAQSAALQIAQGGTGRGTIQSAPSGNSWAAWDANVNFSANAFIPKFTTTATAAGTTTLLITTPQTQIFTGTNIQTVKLPTTSVVQGGEYLIQNLSTGVVTLQSSGGNTIVAMASNTQARCVCLVNTPTTAANWSVTYQSLNGGPIGSYAQAFHNQAATWSTSSATFVDPTVSGTPALTVRVSSGITLTTAGSSLPGITFTPASAQAAYQITATLGVTNASVSGAVALQLTDGTTVISVSPGVQEAGTGLAITTTMTGFYAPASASAVTVKVQMAIDTGASATIQSLGFLTTPAIEWTVLRIA